MKKEVAKRGARALSNPPHPRTLGWPSAPLARALHFETLEDRRLLAQFGPLPAVADGEVNSLRSAITQANSNNQDDVIVLDAGVFELALSGAQEDTNSSGDLDVTEPNQSITLRGAGVGETIITAAGIDRILDVFAGASLHLHDLSLTGGSVVGDGGAIRVVSGEVQLTNVEVLGNQATGKGGGLVGVSQATVGITRSHFSNNNAASDGGAVVFEGSNLLTIAASQFTENTSGRDGGALHPGLYSLKLLLPMILLSTGSVATLPLHQNSLSLQHHRSLTRREGLAGVAAREALARFGGLADIVLLHIADHPLTLLLHLHPDMRRVLRSCRCGRDARRDGD